MSIESGGRFAPPEREPSGEKAWEFTNEKQREALKMGVAEMKRYLEDLRAERGKLPDALVFPETSTRPLAAALEPLFRQAYGEDGRKVPDRLFVKTLRPQDAEGEGRKTPAQQRVEEILRDNPEGDLLVIDDVAAGGETFSQIREAVDGVDPERRVDYFAFIALSSFDPEKAGVDPERFRSAISENPVGAKLPRGPEGRIDWSQVTEEQEKEYDSWNGVLGQGFLPYRKEEKSEITGVRKIRNESKYVEPSPEADPGTMAAARDEFRRIGEEALAELEQEEDENSG